MHCLHILLCVDIGPFASHALVVLASAILSAFALSSFHALIRQQCCMLSMNTVGPLVQYCPALVFLQHCPCIEIPALFAINQSYCCLFQALVFMQCHPCLGSPAVSSVHWSSCIVIHVHLVFLLCHPCLDSRALSSAIDSPALSYMPWFSCIVTRALVLL